ncbi:hypothetical protein NFJ02_02g70700 [Pycnococcus provasolii]
MARVVAERRRVFGVVKEPAPRRSAAAPPHAMRRGRGSVHVRGDAEEEPDSKARLISAIMDTKHSTSSDDKNALVWPDILTKTHDIGDPKEFFPSEELQEKAEKKKSILVLDGGGLRGLIIACVLERVEKSLEWQNVIMDQGLLRTSCMKAYLEDCC